MSGLIQSIDRRIAKFTTKDSISKTTLSSKELRNIKLDPLGILQAEKQEAEVLQKNINGMSIKKRGKKIRTRKESEKVNKSTVFKHKTQILFEQSHERASLYEKDDEDCLEFEEKNQDEQRLPRNAKEKIKVHGNTNKLSEKKCVELWQKIADSMKKTRKNKLLCNFHWYLYKSWKSVMEKGLNKIKSNWKKIRNATITIQKSYKMHRARKFYKKTLLSCKKIQKYFKNVYKSRKIFKLIKKLALFLQKYARRFYKRRSSAAILIQKTYKMHKTYKIYKKSIAENLAVQKHKEMLKKQASLVKERNLKKNAVKTIEKYWMLYKEKLKLKEIRKYLFSLPYECRLLYLKFKQVKQDADNLKNDVDMMIARKKAKMDQGSF